MRQINPNILPPSPPSWLNYKISPSPGVSGAAAQVEAVALPDTPSPTTPLLQVGLRGPHGGVVREVVVRCEQLHLGSDSEYREKRKGEERRGDCADHQR